MCIAEQLGNFSRTTTCDNVTDLFVQVEIRYFEYFLSYL
jgi:hypothetical protein